MRTPLVVTLACCVLVPLRARAGGFELPDNGAEPMGRGGAFVAKADSGLALQYNVAGFGRQKGTRATVDVNLVMQDLRFTRAGSYSTMPDVAYPTIRDGEKVFPIPFLGLSTDLGGRLRNFTLAAGVYGPHSPGRHNWGVGADVCEGGTCEHPPATVDGKPGSLPAPTRYDVARTDLLIIFPTLAAAWRPHPAISLGFGWQVVYANFDLSNANLTPLGRVKCPVADDPACDAYGRVRASGSSFSSSSENFKGSEQAFSPGISSFGWLFGLMLHPADWLDLGWSFRPGIDVNAEGTIHASPPEGVAPVDDAHIVFKTHLPAWMRLGGRLVAHHADGTERADVELNLVWENWSQERYDLIHSDDFRLGKGGQLDARVLHFYKDTFGVRLGGSYTARLGERVRLTGRAGAYYDSSATDPSLTRLDFNTLDKWGFTLGAGLKVSGFTFNVGYAYVWSPSRRVTDSQILGLSSYNGSNYDKTDAQIPVGNGRWEAQTHVLSLGLTFNFSEFRRKPM